MEQINVIGIGLDGELGLSKQARQTISQATVLSGAERHLSYFPEHPATKVLLKNLERDIELIISKAIAKEKVVILASGDPLFFGLGRLLLSKIPANKLIFYPHLSSVQLAFSKLKLPWQDASLVSVHGRDCDELIKCWKQGKDKIAVLTDREHNPVAIANLFLSLQLPLAYSWHICANLTVEEAEIDSFGAEEVENLAQLSTDKFSSLNVIIFLREDVTQKTLDLSTLPLIGIPDSAFSSFRDRPSLITKKEIRSLIITELSLQPQQTIWDIGAGTGSVSIEIARICPTATIYALEKTAMGINLIWENCQRFQINNIQAIVGKAPEALADLPTPERIFIGGSGGNLESILDNCQAKIALQGIIVLAIATVENISQVIAWAKQNNWHYSLLQVQISRSTPIADLTRFSPLNPVTIVKLKK